MKLEGRRVLVTGGNKGIGKSVVKLFAQEGAEIVYTFNSGQTDALTLRSDLREKYDREFYPYKLNLERDDSIYATYNYAIDKLGCIDILINNAGLSLPAKFENMSEYNWDRVMDVNLNGMFKLTKLVVSGMTMYHYGKIINVTSTAGLYGTIGQANYAASKAAVVGFSKSLSRELGKYNINVNVICPGITKTDMTETLQRNDKFRKIYESRISLGRFAECDDIAPSFLFLSSDDSEYITGHVLSVDGGYNG